MQISINVIQYAPELSKVYLNGKESRIRLGALEVAQIAKDKDYRKAARLVRALYLAPKGNARGLCLTYEFKAGPHTHETRVLGTREQVAEKLKKAKQGFDLHGVGYTVPQVTVKKVHSIF